MRKRITLQFVYLLVFLILAAIINSLAQEYARRTFYILHLAVLHLAGYALFGVIIAIPKIGKLKRPRPDYRFILLELFFLLLLFLTVQYNPRFLGLISSLTIGKLIAFCFGFFLMDCVQEAP